MANKSHVKKSNRAVLVVLAIIILGVIIGISSSLSNSPDSGDNNGALNQNPQSSANDDVSNDITPPQIKTYSFNERFNKSGYSVSASNSGDYSWDNIGFSLVKRGAFTALRGNTVAPKQGSFYIVFASAKNVGNEKQDIGFSLLYNSVLVDEKGNRYSNDDTTDLVYMIQYNWGYFSDYHEQREVNPNLQAKDFVAFDVPNGKYKLCDSESTFCVNLQ